MKKKIASKYYGVQFIDCNNQRYYCPNFLIRINLNNDFILIEKNPFDHGILETASTAVSFIPPLLPPDNGSI